MVIGTMKKKCEGNELGLVCREDLFNEVTFQWGPAWSDRVKQVGIWGKNCGCQLPC